MVVCGGVNLREQRLMIACHVVMVTDYCDERVFKMSQAGETTGRQLALANMQNVYFSLHQCHGLLKIILRSILDAQSVVP